MAIIMYNNGNADQRGRTTMIGMRLLAMGTGYIFDNFLTADVVARLCTGKRAEEIGSGNPGMANIMSHVGKKAGVVVLLGDIVKTLLAFMAAWRLTGSFIDDAALLWAGMGAVLGHNFPVWNHFRGGKGVTVTCTWLIIYMPLWGTVCCIAGGVLTLLTGYLPLGAFLIALFAVPAAFLSKGLEAGICMTVFLLLMISRHYRGLKRMADKKEKRFFRK